MASIPFDISALTEELYTNSKNITNNPEARQKCLAAARTLTSALETPLETKLRLHYTEPTHQVTIRLGIDLGLFKALADLHKENGKPVHTEELAKRTGSEADLLGTPQDDRQLRFKKLVLPHI